MPMTEAGRQDNLTYQQSLAQKTIKKDLRQILPKKSETALSHEEQAKQNWEKQKDRLIALGFHRLRNLSEEAYRAMLPKYEPPSLETTSHPYTLLVDPLDPLEQMSGIYHIEDDMSDRFGKMETTANAAGVNTPLVPYQISVNHGRDHRGQNLQEAEKSLKQNERLITLAEGLVLLREYPQIWLEARTNLNPYGLSMGGTTIRIANGTEIVDGKIVLSSDDRLATPEISHYYVSGPGGPMSHREINLFDSNTFINSSGGWPTAHITHAT